VTVTPSRQLIVALGEHDASHVAPDASERDSAPPVAPDVAARIARAFGAGSGAGLLELGAAEPATPLPPALGFWRDFAARYIAAVCARGDATETPLAPPDEASLAALAAAAPPMIGGEYVDAALLAEHWAALDGALAAALADHGGSVARFLQARHAAWNLVGRVHFNLAENRGDDDAPFAFLATYTTRLTARATAQHVPLGQALREYAGARARSQLAQLLAPVRRAADGCPWLAEMV
jgi:non-specific serine/threonine protein kinase